MANGIYDESEMKMHSSVWNLEHWWCKQLTIEYGHCFAH